MAPPGVGGQLHDPERLGPVEGEAARCASLTPRRHAAVRAAGEMDPVHDPMIFTGGCYAPFPVVGQIRIVPCHLHRQHGPLSSAEKGNHLTFFQVWFGDLGPYITRSCCISPGLATEVETTEDQEPNQNIRTERL